MLLCSCCKAAVTRCCRYSTLLHSTGLAAHFMETHTLSNVHALICALNAQQTPLCRAWSLSTCYVAWAITAPLMSQ